MSSDIGITRENIEVLKSCVQIFKQNRQVIMDDDLEFLRIWVFDVVREHLEDFNKFHGESSSKETKINEDSSDTIGRGSNMESENTFSTLEQEFFETYDENGTNDDSWIENAMESGSVKHLKVQILTNGDSEASKSKMKISTVANASENSKQLRIKNGNFKKPFSCKICNKNFKSVSGLAMHVNQHTQNIDFTCPICSKSYNYSSSLKYHLKNQVCIRKHNKNMSGLEYLETLVDKNQIRKKFSNKITNNKLNSRIKRPFQCGDCGHTFDDPKILKTHYIDKHATET